MRCGSWVKSVKYYCNGVDWKYVSAIFYRVKIFTQAISATKDFTLQQWINYWHSIPHLSSAFRVNIRNTFYSIRIILVSCRFAWILQDLYRSVTQTLAPVTDLFLLEKKCLSHLLWLNGKIFLIGTNGIQKFENLACSHNFLRFLIAL